ncbi:MAG: hypothetical protein PUC88_01575 [Clostridia bacterium]|nr:hypothetical protein [Clostridia bacterium]
MEKISAYAVIISMASICAGLMNIISPDGAMKKVFRYVLSLFLICAIVIPFKDFKWSDIQFSFDQDLPNTSFEISSEIDELTKSKLDESVSQIVQNELESVGVSDATIKIIMDIDSDNCIYITRAEVYIKKSYVNLKQTIKNNIKTNIGIDADIYLTGE